VSSPHDLASSLQAAADSLRPTIQATVHRCPTCNQHFSGDARFCPFDGDPLVAAVGYRPEADPLIGKLIDGRYEVESVLGEGGMGSVYCVRHRALEKRFALKVMRADLASKASSPRGSSRRRKPRQPSVIRTSSRSPTSASYRTALRTS